MLGFKTCATTQSTLVGIELVHMLRKGNWKMGLSRASL